MASKMGLRINSNACFLVVLAIGAFLQTSSALKCWSCTTSSTTDACADPLNSTEHSRRFHTVDCEANSPQNSWGTSSRYICKKIVQKENGRTVIIRKCDNPDVDEVDITNGPCGPHTATQSHVTMQSCHICNTDYCNGASSISGMQLVQACVIAVITCALSPSIRSFF